MRQFLAVDGKERNLNSLLSFSLYMLYNSIPDGGNEENIPFLPFNCQHLREHIKLQPWSQGLEKNHSIHILPLPTPVQC